MTQKSKINYVYELVDSSGKIIYVGESVRPGIRFRQHLNEKRSHFYGRTDIKMCIIPEMFTTKLEAYWKQVELQKKYNLTPENLKHIHGFDGTKIYKRNQISNRLAELRKIAQEKLNK
jgi:predicted GIY-YIG superfamily endonuclease